MPTDPAAVFTPPGNAPAAPVVPPAPAAAAPQSVGAVLSVAAAPVAASATLGTGNSAVTFTARAPGADGNRIFVEIDTPAATDPLWVSAFITEGDVGNPPYPKLYVVPGISTVPSDKVVISGAVGGFGNGTYNTGGVSFGKLSYYNGSSAIFWNTTAGGYWAFSPAGGGAVAMKSAANTATPDLASGWVRNDTAVAVAGFAVAAEAASTTTATTAAQLAAAINAIPGIVATAVAGGTGAGAVAAGWILLSGGTGITAPPDVRWPHPGPGVLAPVTPPSPPAAAPQSVGLVLAIPGNSPAAPVIPPTPAAAAPQTVGPILPAPTNTPTAPAAITP